MSEPLVSVFKKSLDSGEIPVIWRQANILLIFKKGDKMLTVNYRLASLISLLGKIVA